MAYFEDLQSCTAFPGEWRNLLAVGWLGKGHEYTRGAVAPEVLERLRRTTSWEPPEAAAQLHVCELCGEEEGSRTARGAIFVPGDGVLFVTPRLINHFIRKHGYQPPATFLEAVNRWGHPVPREAVTEHLVGFDQQTPPDPQVPIETVERVRQAPHVYLGSTGAPALEAMLWAVLRLFIDQHLDGTSTKLSVQIDDGGWVTVEDDGEGIGLEPVARSGRPLVEAWFGQLSYPSLPPRPVSSAFAVKHRPELSRLPAVLTALSSRLEVETRRNADAWRMAFASGHQVQPLTMVGATSERGTFVRYRPDDEIFDQNVKHDLDLIGRQLRALAWLCPKLDVRFNGRSLHAPDGLSTWLPEAAPELVKETLLRGTGTVDGIDVEFALGWRPRSKATLVRSFVNYAETSDGGSHARGLTLAVENMISAKRASRLKTVLAGLVGIVHVGQQYPRLVNRGRQLDDKKVRNAVRDVVTRAINEAPWWWDKLHTAIG